MALRSLFNGLTRRFKGKLGQQAHDVSIGKYHNIGAIAIATTGYDNGDVISLGLVDSNCHDVLHGFYRPTVNTWNEHFNDYGLSYESLARCPLFTDCVTDIQAAIDRFDLLLIYNLVEMDKFLERDGIVFNMPVVSVKGAHIDFLGGVTLTIDIFTGEAHHDFDNGETTVETARKTMSVFLGLPASYQNEYIEKAEGRLGRRERRREWDVILKRKEDATPEPCMEVPDVPEGQRPFGRKEYLRTVEMYLDENQMPYERRRWYHADSEAMDEVLSDMGELLDLMHSGKYKSYLTRDDTTAKMEVASLTKSGGRRKYPIIVEFMTNDPDEDLIDDYDDDGNPIDKRGNAIEVLPYIFGKLYYLANGDVGKANVTVEGKRAQFKRVNGKLEASIVE